MPNEVVMQRIDAIQIRRVSGDSKLNSFRPLYFASEMAWLMKYEQPDMKSIRNRIAKIQTMSFACRSRKLVVCVASLNRLKPLFAGSLKYARMPGSVIASVMKA